MAAEDTVCARPSWTSESYISYIGSHLKLGLERLEGLAQALHAGDTVCRMQT